MNFEDTYNFVIEAYTNPCLWGEYNILILPPSYLFGGMEILTLIFIIPSFLAGDKSLLIL